MYLSHSANLRTWAQPIETTIMSFSLVHHRAGRRDNLLCCVVGTRSWIGNCGWVLLVSRGAWCSRSCKHAVAVTTRTSLPFLQRPWLSAFGVNRLFTAARMVAPLTLESIHICLPSDSGKWGKSRGNKHCSEEDVGPSQWVSVEK